MERSEITIIGAGAVGLAIAQRLSVWCKNIFVLEKERSFGQGASSRNSEVIHAGIYYPSLSLKAKTCVLGNRLLYELCDKQGIAFKKLGKLIVAVTHEEIEQLKRLHEQGVDNGVKGLVLLDQAQVTRMEPNIRARAGLFSPETGIIDSHALMAFLARSAQENGASIAYQSKVIEIQKKKTGYEIVVQSPDGETFVFESTMVINAAGLFSDTIAHAAGMDIEKLDYQLSFCKGQYFRLSAQKSNMVNRLVYPVPEQGNGGLGIHLTPDLSAQVRLGPDSQYLKKREEDYSVDISRQKYFIESVRQFAPFIDEGDCGPDTAGIRAKLQKQGQGFRDFVIQEESSNGCAGFINCIGIESPGLTASLAIAREAENLLPIG